MMVNALARLFQVVHPPSGHSKRHRRACMVSVVVRQHPPTIMGIIRGNLLCLDKEGSLPVFNDVNEDTFDRDLFHSRCYHYDYNSTGDTFPAPSLYN
mmetsp:Transcript_12494/g.17859  ORF Transcript_12494/g.17859 Transcript_12494/m.17859 type:complete len:97 (+) Transcript_12494:156-446(+)